MHDGLYAHMRSYSFIFPFLLFFFLKRWQQLQSYSLSIYTIEKFQVRLLLYSPFKRVKAFIFFQPEQKKCWKVATINLRGDNRMDRVGFGFGSDRSGRFDFLKEIESDRIRLIYILYFF
jgi:hypothetical protein